MHYELSSSRPPMTAVTENRDLLVDATAPAEARPALRLHRILDLFERGLGVVFGLVVVLNFVSAAGRYLGGKAIVGADEVQVYVMIWLIFLGSAMAAMRGVHLRMDVLTTGLRPRLAWWRSVVEMLLIAGVCGGMAVVSARFTLQIYEMGQASDAAEIPMWIPHLSVLVGFAGLTLCALLELVVLLRQSRRTGRGDV